MYVKKLSDAELSVPLTEFKYNVHFVEIGKIKPQ